MKTLLIVALIACVGWASATEKLTPLGPRPAQCVHRVPAGSHIEPVDGGVWVHAPDMTHTWLPELPECVEDMKLRAKAMRAGAALRNSSLFAAAEKMGEIVPSPESALGWLDYTTYVPPSTQHLATFTGYYTVPGNPSDTTGDEVLFYFIGTENINQQDVAILQPVLTWGNGLTGWSYASWNCCPSGQQHESTPIQGFGAGDKLYGEILRDNGSWTISSIHGAQNTSLTVADNGRNFDWMDVTLEVYNINGCTDFAQGPMTFSGMKATDTTGAPMNMQWKAATGQTQCNGKITVDGSSEVVIQHGN
mmetsp:Transcript_82231/g.167499  ORF Transcript_82231/g.167499 Transcript_82231/m.167499 type:complete len:306 (-) Transcript_82231:71-988(-)